MQIIPHCESTWVSEDLDILRKFWSHFPRDKDSANEKLVKKESSLLGDADGYFPASLIPRDYLSSFCLKWHQWHALVSRTWHNHENLWSLTSNILAHSTWDQFCSHMKTLEWKTTWREGPLRSFTIVFPMKPQPPEWGQLVPATPCTLMAVITEFNRTQRILRKAKLLAMRTRKQRRAPVAAVVSDQNYCVVSTVSSFT